MGLRDGAGSPDSFLLPKVPQRELTQPVFTVTSSQEGGRLGRIANTHVGRVRQRGRGVAVLARAGEVSSAEQVRLTGRSSVPMVSCLTRERALGIDGPADPRRSYSMKHFASFATSNDSANFTLLPAMKFSSPE